MTVTDSDTEYFPAEGADFRRWLFSIDTDGIRLWTSHPATVLTDACHRLVGFPALATVKTTGRPALRFDAEEIIDVGIFRIIRVPYFRIRTASRNRMWAIKEDTIPRLRDALRAKLPSVYSEQGPRSMKDALHRLTTFDPLQEMRDAAAKVQPETSTRREDSNS